MKAKSHEETLEDEKTKNLFYEVVKRQPIEELTNKGKDYCEGCGKFRVVMEWVYKMLCTECIKNELMEIYLEERKGQMGNTIVSSKIL